LLDLAPKYWVVVKIFVDDVTTTIIGLRHKFISNWLNIRIYKRTPWRRPLRLFFLASSARSLLTSSVSFVCSRTHCRRVRSSLRAKRSWRSSFVAVEDVCSAKNSETSTKMACRFQFDEKPDFQCIFIGSPATGPPAWSMSNTATSSSVADIGTWSFV
jgi:hypothetical protein